MVGSRTAIHVAWHLQHFHTSLLLPLLKANPSNSQPPGDLPPNFPWGFVFVSLLLLLPSPVLRVKTSQPFLQALRPGVQNSQDGAFRATFEDKPLMSDIIFLRAWIGVDLPKFYNPVTNLLAPAVKPLARELKPGHMASEVSHS